MPPHFALRKKGSQHKLMHRNGKADTSNSRIIDDACRDLGPETGLPQFRNQELHCLVGGPGGRPTVEISVPRDSNSRSWDAMIPLKCAASRMRRCSGMRRSSFSMGFLIRATIPGPAAFSCCIHPTRVPAVCAITRISENIDLVRNNSERPFPDRAEIVFPCVNREHHLLGFSLPARSKCDLCKILFLIPCS